VHALSPYSLLRPQSNIDTRIAVRNSDYMHLNLHTMKFRRGGIFVSVASDVYII